MIRLIACVASSALAVAAFAAPVPKDDKLPPPTEKELTRQKIQSAWSA